jgi:hypothetical protein
MRHATRPPRAEPNASHAEPKAADEAPPFGRSWTTLYALVLAFLAVLIVLFYLFTRAFR